MSEKYYDSLSDMSRIKDSLKSLFLDTADIVRLIIPDMEHCFDTPYIDGALADKDFAVFIETYLTKVENQHIKEVGVDIMAVCRKDALILSDEDKNYFNSIGVFGNRVDSAIQVINSTVLNQSALDMIKEKYSIGNMLLAKENPVKPYIPDKSFYGKCLSYTYQTFLRRKNHGRQVVL